MTLSEIILPTGYSLIVRESVGSTNDEIKLLAQSENGLKEKTILCAKSQSAGRGRYGRQWISEHGNLFFSIYLKPECDPVALPQLSFVSALAARDALKSLVKINFKWPNDLILNNKKFGGILLETFTNGRKKKINGLIIGVGINIKSHPYDTEFPATNLEDEGVKLPGLEIVLNNYLHGFDYWYSNWRGGGFPEIRENWLENAVNLYKVIRVRTAKQVLSGIFQDIAPDGSLVLRSGVNTHFINAGDVFFGG